MKKNKNKVKLSCHCGSIKMELLLTKKVDQVIRCNCSICSKNKGFGMICIPSDNLYLIEGQESMTEYLFNTMEYPHIFCIICGTHTHHKSRSSPGKICINVACIDGFDFDYFSNRIIKFNGVNHPKDSISKG
tara:strand:- start:108 stop:503 length:396 start_codon:yes stop_codon:yes gene_type:complete